jgi:hypothetical protein
MKPSSVPRQGIATPSAVDMTGSVMEDRNFAGRCTGDACMRSHDGTAAPSSIVWAKQELPTLPLSR